jgi:hypothetical protein
LKSSGKVEVLDGLEASLSVQLRLVRKMNEGFPVALVWQSLIELDVATEISHSTVILICAHSMFLKGPSWVAWVAVASVR